LLALIDSRAITAPATAYHTLHTCATIPTHSTPIISKIIICTSVGSVSHLARSSALRVPLPVVAVA
jgi:hypothetical protein